MCKSCNGCVRILMIIFNSLFVLCGLALLGLSLYFYFGSFALKADKEVNMLAIGLFVMMAVGGLTVIIGICGCCGAYHVSQCLLGTYFAFLLLIFAAEVGAGAIGFIYKDKVETYGNELLDQGVKNAVSSKTGTTEFMDAIQIMFKCCGRSGAQDYALLLKTAPPSCCVGSSENECSKENMAATIFKVMQAKGCSPQIKEKYLILCGFVLGVAFIQLVGLIFSMVLCCSERRKQSEGNHGYYGVATHA